MTKRLLNFKLNKTEQLSVDELKLTCREKINGRPLNGMYHFAFIEAILEQLQEKGLTFNTPTIYAANNKDSRMPGVITDEEKEEECGIGNIKKY